MKEVLIPTDVYKDGDLVRIDFNTPTGDFVVSADWDERDSQTTQNQIDFREWAHQFVMYNLGYEVTP